MAKKSQTGIAVVIPCYKVKKHVLHVLNSIPEFVEFIICVDDGCPENSGNFIENNFRDERLSVLYHPQNRGVGGAMKTGYKAAAETGASIAVKLDGDGQMDPALIAAFVAPIVSGENDYVKGNRFFRIRDVKAMPTARLLGNAALSFMAKLSTGYWELFDPTNGYTALHLSTLDLIEIDKVSDGYFFETDLLFRLNIARCAVKDIPIVSHYSDEISNLDAARSILPFMKGHFQNYCKRIFYSYFLRNFSVASLQIIFGPLLMLMGGTFGAYHWIQSSQTGVPSSAGTVVIAAVLLFSGSQFVFAAIAIDMTSSPKTSIHPSIDITSARSGSRLNDTLRSQKEKQIFKNGHRGRVVSFKQGLVNLFGNSIGMPT